MKSEKNIQARTYLDVQIPEELLFHVKSNYFVAVLGLYLLLKAESPGAGLIQNYPDQTATLSTNFNISHDEFFAYLKEMEVNKLALIEGDNIRIASWNQLGNTLGLKTKKRIQSRFNYAGDQKIDWWLSALEKNNAL